MGKKILVADDESHILHVVSLKLRNAGYSVVTACDGQEALELAQAELPDLLIIDYHMPRLSGLELCQRLKHEPPLCRKAAARRRVSPRRQIRRSGSEGPPYEEFPRLEPDLPDQRRHAPHQSPRQRFLQAGLPRRAGSHGRAGHGRRPQRRTRRPPDPVLYGKLSLPPGTVHRLAEELTPILCLAKARCLVNDLTKDPASPGSADLSAISWPSPAAQDRSWAAYFALDKTDGDFDSQDSKLLNSIANESAIYLENAMLFDDVHGLMMGLLHSLTSAVDAKDAYTCGHSERVAALGRQLTIEAGLGEALAERIYMAGLLHDVGKIGVPESVLQKTGRLTPEEFEQMKKHPQIGARILQDIKQISDLIPGVLHHHERYDGQGYPAGLPAKISPSWAGSSAWRLFRRHDQQPHLSQGMPLEVALTEIRRCSGTQFDPLADRGVSAHRRRKFREAPGMRQEQAKPTTPADRNCSRTASTRSVARSGEIHGVKCEEYSQVCVMEVQGDFWPRPRRGKKIRSKTRSISAASSISCRFSKMRLHRQRRPGSPLWMKRRCEDLFGRSSSSTSTKTAKKSWRSPAWSTALNARPISPRP
jgi:response regulator RpfG family c-di-GMP phosphodiesterase